MFENCLKIFNAFNGKGRKTYICFGLLFILIYGCSGINSRIKENQTEFDTYSPKIQHLLKKGRIRTGFTRTQVYIALGEPFDRQHSKWAYTTCAWKKVVSLKSRLEYESEYERAWKAYSKRKEKNEDAVFIPPARLIEESECRRYISRFVYFENDRVSRVERPMKVIWVEPKW